jgi:hypothetical protein
MNDDDLLLTRITIERRLMADGSDQVLANFEDRDGDMPPLVEVLGMLAITNDTALRVAMGEAPDDDSEDDE